MLRQETIDRALHEIAKGYAQYQYFFDRLDSPSWLEALSRAGFFRKPPEAMPDGQYVRLPFWPESRYLARMAAIPEAQETVLKIALAIPSSENSRVHEDIADIAVALMPAQAAKLVPRICSSIASPVKLTLPEKIGPLIARLAEGGQAEAAMKLASSALALQPDSEEAEKEEDEFSFHFKPTPQFESWYYERIVDKSLPALAYAARVDAVKLFSSLLNDAIRLSLKKGDEGPEDFIYVSHPAIELGRNADDVVTVLLCATRDITQLVIAEDGSNFSEVLAILKAFKWTTFRRLELHLSRVFPGQGSAEAERVFQDTEIIETPSLRHEAILLLQEVFQDLTPDTQNRILQWMDSGPSRAHVFAWFELLEREATEGEIINFTNRGRRDRFSILEGQLPARFTFIYEKLKASLGEPNRQDRISTPKFGAISSQSPQSTEDLLGVPTGEVLEFLRRWIPGTDIFGPTADGLGAALSAVVSQRPTEFAAVAEEFRGLDPTYLRCFFSGLDAALKRGEKWEWVPVLELALWVASQPRSIEGRTGGRMIADPDWGWTRDSVIDLLSTGLGDGQEKLPYEFRVLVWNVLEPLTVDPNPSAQDEIREKFDASFLAINSTRGRALNAVVSYAWWVRQCTLDEREEKGLLPVTFEEMPEVRAVLDAHLDVQFETTLTVRSIYGRHLTTIAILDLEWLRANASRILPPGSEDEPRFNAAWESYVGFNRPNTTLLSILLPAYQLAVFQIAMEGKSHRPISPSERLVEHIMVYYWIGAIRFGGEDNLLEAFYSLAPDALRGRALWFVGTSVPGWNDEAPPEVFDRLRALVELRLAEATKAPSPANFVKELANFGYWFTSEKFDQVWSMKILVAVLQLTKEIEHEMAVVKLLAERSIIYPVECITCLRLLVEGDRDGWLLVGVEDDAKRLLRGGLDSNIPEAAMAARRLTEYLIARGNASFRSLLK